MRSGAARAASPGVLAWLRRRESGCTRRGLGAPYPGGAPPRLRVPVASLLDARRVLQRHILLGFSRDGDQLFCYSQTGGAYTLHAWRFRLGAPASLLASVPLFCAPRAHAAPPHALGDGLFGACVREAHAAARGMRVAGSWAAAAGAPAGEAEALKRMRLRAFRR
jgi:hypothetical protein